MTKSDIWGTPHSDPLLSRGEGKIKEQPFGDWYTLYRGQIDRLVFDGRQWWLLDYKTSRPAAGEDWEVFLEHEVKKYRPQLLAYRDMAAKFFDLNPPEVINTILYFTAAHRHVFL